MWSWWYAPLAAAVAGAVVAGAAEARLAADARLQVFPDGALGHFLRYVHLYTGHHHGGVGVEILESHSTPSWLFFLLPF